MSTLHNYTFGISYGVNELPVGIINLFTPLVEEPSRRVEFVSEIITGGLRGRINLNDFDLGKYENGIRKKCYLADLTKGKKTIALETGRMTESTEVSYGLVMSEDKVNNRLVQKMKDAYEELQDEDELHYAIQTITALNDSFQIDDGVDMLCALKNAIRGIPSAIAVLKDLCNRYEVVADLIQTILSSGKTYSEMFEV